ncbi:hypothetical protein HaLaN_20514, partial [Haematococcus lacustris]
MAESQHMLVCVMSCRPATLLSTACIVLKNVVPATAASFSPCVTCVQGVERHVKGSVHALGRRHDEPCKKRPASTTPTGQPLDAATAAQPTTRPYDPASRHKSTEPLEPRNLAGCYPSTAVPATPVVPPPPIPTCQTHRAVSAVTKGMPPGTTLLALAGCRWRSGGWKPLLPVRQMQDLLSQHATLVLFILVQWQLSGCRHNTAFILDLAHALNSRCVAFILVAFYRACDRHCCCACGAQCRSEQYHSQAHIPPKARLAAVCDPQLVPRTASAQVHGQVPMDRDVAGPLPAPGPAAGPGCVTGAARVEAARNGVDLLPNVSWGRYLLKSNVPDNGQTGGTDTRCFELLYKPIAHDLGLDLKAGA